MRDEFPFRTLAQATHADTQYKACARVLKVSQWRVLHTTMYLRQAGLTRNPTFSYL
jgi:hypothetical protein